MTSQLLTPANQITILRMAFIPVFVILLLYNHLGWAFFVFLLAGVSDGLDGLMARWLQQKTSLGALLDPIADKLLLTTAFVVLSIKDLELPNLIPLWLTILVLSRDVVLIVSTLVILLITGHRNFPPSIFGKATTLIQIITLTLVLLFNYLGTAAQWLSVLYLATGAITVFSGLHYTYRGKRMVSEGPAPA